MKGYFDLVKNFITVAALMAIAKKTNSVPIYAMGWLSFGILGFYITHQMNSWHFEPFHPFGKSRFAFHAGIILWSIIVMVLISGSQYVFFTAIFAILDSNAK